MAELSINPSGPVFSDEPTPPPATADADLAAQKARLELKKLQYDLDEQRSWRWKLFFTSIIAPFGSVLLLFLGWYGSHATQRGRQIEDVYTRAAKELSSPDASVRLNSVKMLDQFVQRSDTTWLAKVSERLFTAKSTTELAEDRRQETMALIIGRLNRETDSSVLDAIAQAVLDHPEESAQPLISMNKTSAVLFARTAGDFAGLSTLSYHRAVAVQDSVITPREEGQRLFDIDTLALRTGSPFQASTRLNQRFSPRDMLTNVYTCGFKGIFDLRQQLSEGSGLNTLTRASPPKFKELAKSRDILVASAATLERSSYILGRLADQNWNILSQKNADQTWRFDLFGTAIVVGELKQETIDALRARGGYYNSSLYYNNNPGCEPARPASPAKP